MPVNESIIRNLLSRDLPDTMIRLGLIALLAAVCMWVVAPFAALIAWAIILAIALYPLHQGLARRLGGRQGRAATLLVLAGLLIIGTPTVMLSSSFAGRAHDAYDAFQDDTVHISQPAPSVAEWPVIGPRVFAAWSSAAQDLPAYIRQNKAQLQDIARRALSMAASTAGSIALFLGSLILAGIMMAYGESGSAASNRIFRRLTTPERGPGLQRLATATVRSVASGVIGVAFIQSLLLGVGFLMAGIPAAGVLAFVALLLGIVQLPALLISLPVIAYLWWSGDASTTSNLVYSAYLLVAGMADNVLKPLLLGRGVDAPMPVVLLGALGGMVSSGIIGLFVGAVALAVGYQIFMEWVDSPGETAAGDPGRPPAMDPGSAASS